MYINFFIRGKLKIEDGEEYQEKEDEENITNEPHFIDSRYYMTVVTSYTFSHFLLTFRLRLTSAISSHRLNN